MKIVDADETHPDRSPEAVDVSPSADTLGSPGLRPEVLGDPTQRRTKALVHAALFKGSDEAPTVGPYQVLNRLGAGGMGVVYAAYDPRLERKVALKLIRGAALQRPEGRERTLREARALARLSHPNVVHVYQVGEVDDEIFVAMEFLTGPTLRDWLAARPRAWPEVLAVFRQAGEGLSAAHRQGVIHRDFKPANVIVGDDGRVRVLDFGLAHFFGSEGGEEMRALPPMGEVTDVLLTQTGAVLGTPAYMAAEQFAGARGDAKTDQFSFCTALYEALYGQRPFAGDKLDALAAAVTDGRVAPVKTGHEVPAWLHRVVLRGLQPDPAARWPGMDALLAALQPPQKRTSLGKIAWMTLSVPALLVGGIGYAYLYSTPGEHPQLAAAQADAEAQLRAATTRAQDQTLLVEAKAASTRDPVETIRALARLAGDEPATWEQARFLAAAAEAGGLPEQVLRAGDRPLAEAWPLAGGGFVARDELGAVWSWKVSEKTGTQVLAPGAANKLYVARDVPVWAVMDSSQVRVFGADREQTIAVGELAPFGTGWRLASDGRTLVASIYKQDDAGVFGEVVYLWDLTRPGSTPRTITVPSKTFAVVAEDASLVVYRVPRGIRVVRPHEGSETTLKYAGRPWVTSADGRFVVAVPDDKDGVMDVLELATGKRRRVEAESVTVLSGADVLFSRTSYERPTYRRESLATGEVAWSLQVPAQSGGSRLVLDPVHEQLAVQIGDRWGIGDLRRGELRSFMTVPKDRSPRWAGEGALMLAVGAELRLHRPADSPLQMRQQGLSCGLAPGGRWAVVAPHDLEHGEYTRVDLATQATTTFRCPSKPPLLDVGGGAQGRMVDPVIDGDGQVALFSSGWSCWWDERQGARVGTVGPDFRVEALPHGVAVAAGSEVEVRSGPEDVTRRWTVAGPVRRMEASPSGALLAVRSDRGVQVLGVDDGASRSVITRATPGGVREGLAGALAWSPDSTRLALLDQVEGTLELSVWDVVGEPREVARHDLKDSPGRVVNLLTFTPAGTTVALSDREGSILRVDLDSGERRSLVVPQLFRLHMRSETDAIAIDHRGQPLLVDFAVGEVAALTPDVELGYSTGPAMQPGEDGSLWTCASLGSGTLVELGGVEVGSAPQDTRAHVQRLAAAL